MMRFSECQGRAVLDTATAQVIGRVDGFVVDASRRRIHAVRVGKNKHGSVLGWSDILAFGPDAVTIGSAAVVGAPAGEFDDAGDFGGRRVLTDQGFERHSVDDVEFDEATGEIMKLQCGDSAIDGASLLGAGQYAIVIRHPEPTSGQPR